MNYFQYQYHGSHGRIWSLFSGLANLSRGEVLNKNKNWDYSHTTEIISSAMSGNLSTDYAEGFDLRAYEIKCASTDTIEIEKSRKKYLTIVDKINGSDDAVGYGEISENDLRLRVVNDAIELFEDNEEFESCLAQLFHIRESYIVERGVDPVEMLVSSLKGIPEAVSSIRDLVIEDSVFKHIVEVLCEYGKDKLQGRLDFTY